MLNLVPERLSEELLNLSNGLPAATNGHKCPRHQSEGSGYRERSENQKAPLNPSYLFLCRPASTAALWNPTITAEFLCETLCLV